MPVKRVESMHMAWRHLFSSARASLLSDQILARGLLFAEAGQRHMQWQKHYHIR